MLARTYGGVMLSNETCHTSSGVLFTWVPLCGCTDLHHLRPPILPASRALFYTDYITTVSRPPLLPTFAPPAFCDLCTVPFPSSVSFRVFVFV